MALTQAVKEATWLRLLMTELVLEDNQSQIAIKGDNQSSISLANNPALHSRTKHIDIQHHYIRDEVQQGRINLIYTSTKDMIADGLTKSLSMTKFYAFLQQMRMQAS